MAKYTPKKIEKKWQNIWEKEKVFYADNLAKSDKPKIYLLVEFPYPSGTGLHVGHCRSYIALDVIARKKRMEAYNVLFPMGWDAFGLPTENYAIKTRVHPAVATRKNTAAFKKQEKSLGLSFDWSREINTTDPAYYKWTQWIFIQLFKNGLAYKAALPINWCPACKIGLANEEVIAGSCERCGAKVSKKEKEQWVLKITKYADRLLQDLEKVDYPERVKISQQEWIGRSEGIEVRFPLIAEMQAGPKERSVEVFTTRLDTIFGATYLVMAPEHPLVEEFKNQITNYKFVKDYIAKSKTKTEKDRTSAAQEKEGIELKGIKAVNPANSREIPIFISDYVLANYATGTIMAVPAHDQRDFDFAKRYNLSIVEVVRPQADKEKTGSYKYEKAYEGEGILVNSGRFTGMKSFDSRQRIAEYLFSQGLAKKAVHYKLRDWIFSRQRYWGEPIPMVYCQKCASTGGSAQAGWQPLEEKDLPLELPTVKNYKPTEAGDSPLAKVEKWVKTICPKCKSGARRETDVMPNWAGSNWYYLAYIMRGIFNFQFPISKYEKSFEYWMPVDWYNGGMEHTTLHLLYSRFIYKFLWDIGAVPKSVGDEPYKKRTSHGIILGEGGLKMSKSKGNVVNPDDVVKECGADTMRVYEMFMGPFEQMIPWDSKGVKGVRRFLQKVWDVVNKIKNQESGIKNQEPKIKKILHKTIKKVSEDIEALKFNTAVSALMELVNAWQQDKTAVSEEDTKNFLKILSPFAPHIAEELWNSRGFKGLCCVQAWPKYDLALMVEENINLIIQINGKVRDKMELASNLSEEEVKNMVLARPKIKQWLAGKEVKKVIFVKNRLVNIVV